MIEFTDHTMSSFLSLLMSAETANVVTQQATSERYVLITALCWSTAGVTNTLLKLGQYIHKKTVPT
jgi:hypothetical protein